MTTRAADTAGLEPAAAGTPRGERDTTSPRRHANWAAVGELVVAGKPPRGCLETQPGRCRDPLSAEAAPVLRPLGEPLTVAADDHGPPLEILLEHPSAGGMITASKTRIPLEAGGPEQH